MGAYQSLVLATSGLVAYWPLNETSGTTANELVAGRNGTYTGTVTLGAAGSVKGEGTGVTFAQNAYVAVPTNAALHPGDTISIECWTKRDQIVTGGVWQCFYDPAANEGNFGFQSSNQLMIRKDSVAFVTQSTASYTDITNWHHYVFTKNGATWAIYIDGVAIALTDVGNQTLVASSADLKLLADSAGNESVVGTSQCYALYNVALSAATVQAHYVRGTTLQTSRDPWGMNGFFGT